MKGWKTLLDFRAFKVLTFDCYGTLIDWESGILNALARIREEARLPETNDDLLEHFALIESSAQHGEYKTYKEILREVMRNMAGHFQVTLDKYGEDTLATSIMYWKPFPDTVEALRFLKRHYKLAIISNIDDDLFAHSARHLEVPFDWVITAEQVRSYKPSLNNFEKAVERIGRPKHEILHVAQSLYHDIGPANEVGLANVWVNRRKDQNGPGATHPADAVPTMEVPSLDALAKLVTQAFDDGPPRGA
jgi:2-haloacid dehalogenase